MENIVMRYFRQIYGYTLAETAHYLSISADEHLHIETGEQLLSESQAKQLAKVSNVQKDLLLEAVEQLNVLLARKCIYCHTIGESRAFTVTATKQDIPNGTLKAVPLTKHISLF